jgi:hypothetical protein
LKSKIESKKSINRQIDLTRVKSSSHDGQTLVGQTSMTIKSMPPLSKTIFVRQINGEKLLEKSIEEILTTNTGHIIAMFT